MQNDEYVEHAYVFSTTTVKQVRNKEINRKKKLAFPAQIMRDGRM